MLAGRRMGICGGLLSTLYAASAYSVTIGAATPPAGPVFAAIQTASGNYITAVNGGGLGGPDSGRAAVALHTDATAAGAWETFTVIWLNPTYTKFALRTSGGKYVTAVQGGGIGGPNDNSSPVHTDAKRIAEWERLKLTFLPSNQLTINVPNGQFLTAVKGGEIRGLDSAPIRTDAVRYGNWETFTLIDQGTASAALIVDPVAPDRPVTPLKLPALEGAWVVNIVQSGGIGGGYIRYSIDSVGEGSESKRNGDVWRKVPPNLLADVETQVRAAESQPWLSGDNTSCNDCPRTSIDLSLRQPGGGVITHSAGWTLLPPKSPSNTRALVDAVQSALQ